MTRDSASQRSLHACSGCGGDLDLLTDTHYRVGEEERPVKSLEKAEDELEFDDFFSSGWVLCPGCLAKVIDDV